MKRHASAQWRGSLKDGKGTMSTGSGALSGASYSVPTRFESAPGTNPEELVAAAHAGCFSMAFSGELGRAGMTPEAITTTATIDFDKTDDGWTVKSVHLDVTVRVPGADAEKVKAAAEAAKKGCPISRLLKADITMSVSVA